jgi:hypothetical protein
MAMNNKHIDIFIKNKRNEIPTNYIENTNKFILFYSDITNDDLAYLFAYLHCEFNILFEFVNYKITINNHYNADESRELISIIVLYQKLNNSLMDSKYTFKIDNEYLKIINICNTFLKVSVGSAIPDDFKKIDIIEVKPIFNLISLSSKNNKDISIIKNKVFYRSWA